jgi:Iron/zinc purple acid phosphatase-like protein C
LIKLLEHTQSSAKHDELQSSTIWPPALIALFCVIAPEGARVNLSSWPVRQIMTSLCIAQGLSRDYLDQPKWSAMREASYGHATLDFESATAATFRWHRNQVRMQRPLVLRHSCSFSTCAVDA